MHYTETGNSSGVLAIFLHGLGGSTDTFLPILPFFSHETNRLICVDFEGSGQTPLSSPDVKLSIPRYVNDLEYLIASLQDSAGEKCKEKILLIGHSLGSIVAMHYASKHPDKVQGLALLGPGRSIAQIPIARERMLGLAEKTRTGGIEAAGDIAAFSNFPPGDTVALAMRDSVRKAVGKCDAEAYARTCEAIAGLDHLDPDYSGISAPTLLLAGSGDLISPPERSFALQGLIGDNAWVHVLDGVGHQMILQDLHGTVSAIKVLLEKVGR